MTSAEIREIGELLFGEAWQMDMARGLGVPRQSVAYYLKAGGVNGAQAAAIVGLVARIVLSEGEAAADKARVADFRREALKAVLKRIDFA